MYIHLNSKWGLERQVWREGCRLSLIYLIFMYKIKIECTWYIMYIVHGMLNMVLLVAKYYCTWCIVRGTLNMVFLVAKYYCTWCIVRGTLYLVLGCLPSLYLARPSITGHASTPVCTICNINQLTDSQIFVTEIMCFTWIHISGSWSDNVQSIWCQSWPLECGDNCVPVSNRKRPISGLLYAKTVKANSRLLLRLIQHDTRG